MKRLVRLPRKGRVVVVGDTHGDYQASRLVVKNYLDRNTFLIFLGDYVDRGPSSRENIDYLLELREKNQNLILLAGNHETYPVLECSPADFWDSLVTTPQLKNYYRDVFLKLPLAVAGNGFLALHGGLPDVKTLKQIDEIETGDENWFRITWADFRDKPGEYLGDFLGRPKLGKDYFQRVMKSLRRNVLVRSHDPLAPERMFDNRCLTIFTSSAYGRERKIAITNLNRCVHSVEDFEIISF